MRVEIVELAAADGAVVCPRCAIADTIWTRNRGLLGRARLEPGEGLLIRPANSIHTAFMRFPIDVVFLDRDLAVLKVVPELRPWRAAAARRARSVLELPAGGAGRAGLEPGRRLVVR